MSDIPNAQPTNPADDLESTINVMSGGVSGISLDGGVDYINRWITTLEGTGNDAIVSNLQALKEQLSGEVDGETVRNLLMQLGGQVASVANEAPAGVVSQLQELGQLLTSAAGNIPTNS